MDLDEIQLDTEEQMEKAINYLKSELRGIRTGRAATGMVEHVKVDYYGSMTDLKSIAMITVPEPTQIAIKPFESSMVQAVVKAIQGAGLGLNPMSDGKIVRLSVPPLSRERRLQISGTVKKMGEEAKVSFRNARRDANKHLDQLAKEKSAGLSEDDIEAGKTEIQEMLKKYEQMVDDSVASKMKEIEEV